MKGSTLCFKDVPEEIKVYMEVGGGKDEIIGQHNHIESFAENLHFWKHKVIGREVKLEAYGVYEFYS